MDLDQAETQTAKPNTEPMEATEPKAAVLVPLYIYPLTDETWQSLYEAIAAHPSVTFLVIVNPNSGPGGVPLPSHDYVREVPKLNAPPNVATVGYIRIDYCLKPLEEVRKEIDTYAGWGAASGNPLLYVEGILLDETPNHFSPERREYLEALRQHIKSSDGLRGARMVIHNPGTPPDAELADPGPDVIVTCEEPYSRYQGEEVQTRLKEYPYEQPRSGYMLSAVPGSEVGRVVRELRHRGAYVFATSLVDDFYESFGACWGDFVGAFE